MPYPNEHSFRIADPGKFERIRRENDKFGKGVDVLWGVKGENVEVQAIRFNKDKFSFAEAKQWIKDHDYHPIESEEATGKELKKGGEIMERKDLNLFMPFQKFDDSKREVEGVITAEVWDGDNDLLTFPASKAAFEEYEKWRNVREMHQMSAVGTMPLIEYDPTNKRILGKAKIIDDAAWEKCKTGVYKGFSVRGPVKSAEFAINPNNNEVGRRVTGYTVAEVSICDRPKLPESVFSLVKVEGGVQDLPVDPLGKKRTEEELAAFAHEHLEHPGFDDYTIWRIVDDHKKTRGFDVTVTKHPEDCKCEDCLDKEVFKSVFEASAAVIERTKNPADWFIVTDTETPEAEGKARAVNLNINQKGRG